MDEKNAAYLQELDKLEKERVDILQKFLEWAEKQSAADVEAIAGKLLQFAERIKENALSIGRIRELQRYYIGDLIFNEASEEQKASWNERKIAPHVVREWLEKMQKHYPGRDRLVAKNKIAIHCACDCDRDIKDEHRHRKPFIVERRGGKFVHADCGEPIVK